jgi:polysaccharide deacetylase 2 family uncharacterized protein YibQ
MLSLKRRFEEQRRSLHEVLLNSPSSSAKQLTQSAGGLAAELSADWIPEELTEQVRSLSQLAVSPEGHCPALAGDLLGKHELG